MDDGDLALTKALWTDADFDAMGWHDAKVHAMAFEESEFEASLLLDLDYIVRWIEPQPPAEYFTFLIAPATLVFENVSGLSGDLSLQRTMLEIADLHRGEAETERQRNAGVVFWRIEGQDFELRFHATGFHQHFRARPVRSDSQLLPSAERGGISFAQPIDFSAIAD